MQRDALFAKGAYIELSTTEFPDGEIRGQIVELGGDNFISGVVLQDNGSPLEGVLVDDGFRQVQTNASGVYTILNVPNGVYQLTAKQSGFSIAGNLGTNPAVASNGNLINRSFTATVCDSLSCGAEAEVDNYLPVVTDSPMVSYPALGTWNGFNQHVNVIECSNFSDDFIEGTISVVNNGGSEIGLIGVSIPAGATQHFVLNEFDIADQYGTFVISPNNESESFVDFFRCYTSVYRMAEPGSAKPVEYAFVLPVVNSITGVTSGIFNSFNAANAGIPAFNWLSVYNSGSEFFSAKISVYNQSGSVEREIQTGALR